MPIIVVSLETRKGIKVSQRVQFPEELDSPLPTIHNAIQETLGRFGLNEAELSHICAYIL